MTANGAGAANIQDLLRQALACQQQGRLEQAEAMYNHILSINPTHFHALHYLGVIYDLRGDFNKAIELIEKSININPNDAEAYNNLGLAYKSKGDWMQAVNCYKHALKLDPNYPEVIYNIGIALHHAEMYEQAIDYYKQVLQMSPGYAEIYVSMGRTYYAMGKPAEEVACCEQALSIKPSFPEAYINMGVAYADMSKMEESEQCFRKAIEINPNYTGALFNLSVMLEEQGKTQEAEAIYRTVLAKQPDFYAALHNISSVLQQQGKVEDARNHFKHALSIENSDAIKIKLALLTSPIFASKEDILVERDAIERNIRTLMKEGLSLDNPYLQVGAINFYHAFHGLNNKMLNSLIGDFFISTCPELAWESPHINTPRNTKNPIRIGILSHFWKEHTITKFMHGIVEKLPRDRFEVILIAMQGAEDFMTHAIKSVADYVVSIPKALTTARDEIASHELDILFYPDIGMESFSSFLAHSKLARVQCVTWGHPDTSGIPAIDYFISQQDIETPGSQDAYSEQLIAFKELPTYYYPPEAPAIPKDKAFFNIPEHGKMYLCPQTLFKFHPDFDAILGEVLRRDKDSFLVLIDGNSKYWNTLIKERFERSIPDVAERVHFVRRLSKDNFLSLCMLADAILDPVYFGGGNTSYEAFALGLPIVTLPGEFMRGRVTYGCYKKMGMIDLVAKDIPDYINLAHRLANDAEFRQNMIKRIKESSPVLYKNEALIDELSDFLQKALEYQERGEKITTWPLA